MTDPKQADLERALRHALRPVEPRTGFEERVMLALDASRDARLAGARGLERLAHWITPLAQSLLHPARLAPRWALGSATAAALALVAIGTLSYREHLQAVRAEQTRGQVLEALRIANDKFDVAFRLVAEDTGSGGSAPAQDGRSELN